MGTSCTTCNTCKGQEGKLEFETDFQNRRVYEVEYSKKTIGECPTGQEDNLTKESSNPKIIQKITKLQALIRGHQTRKMLRETFSEDGKLEFKTNYKFPNGAVYTGQWLNGQRHGMGSQIWPDGARYEGHWKFNQANGKGKFFHIDGDIYEGNWVNDKANGYGVYIHKNGAKYEGQWKDDYSEFNSH